MSTELWQALITLAGVLGAGLLGRWSAAAAARASERGEQARALVAGEANKNQAAEAVIEGAIALSKGVREELDAVRADLNAERERSNAERERSRAHRAECTAQIRQLQDEVDMLRGERTRPDESRTRATDGSA